MLTFFQLASITAHISTNIANSFKFFKSDRPSLNKSRRVRQINCFPIFNSLSHPLGIILHHLIYALKIIQWETSIIEWDQNNPFCVSSEVAGDIEFSFQFNSFTKYGAVLKTRSSLKWIIRCCLSKQTRVNIPKKR